ncbi:MAG: hypothetical protein AABY87_05615 [bacterium]
MDMPSWLPEMISVDGEWERLLTGLYAIFERDFKQAKRNFQGRPVWWDRRILPGGKYEEGFWHLISKDDPGTADRLFDPRRAERLPWCGPTITNSKDPVVTVWDYRESSGRVRTYVWLEPWDYVVILEKRQQRRGLIAFLITAYFVEGASTRRKLRRKLAEKLA